MLEKGRVLNIRNGRARVEIIPTSLSACGRCALCSATPAGSVILDVAAVPDAKVGGIVTIEVPDVSPLRAVIVLLLVPLLLLIGGIMAGYLLGPQKEGAGINLTALLVGATLMAAWYLSVHFVEKRRPPEPQKFPRIVSAETESEQGSRSAE
jgi:positive regulator of sigma E activity